MGPVSAATGLPSTTAWYMNPYFMAAFGAVAALGFVIFALVFFFMKMRGEPKEAEKCSTCGLTAEMVTKMLPCHTHDSVQARMENIERDLRDLQRRVDKLFDRRG